MSNKDLFRLMDTDSSGGLSVGELRCVIHEQGDYEDEPALDLLFSKMDGNRDGKISFKEAKKYDALS